MENRFLPISTKRGMNMKMIQWQAFFLVFFIAPIRSQTTTTTTNNNNNNMFINKDPNETRTSVGMDDNPSFKDEDPILDTMTTTTTVLEHAFSMEYALHTNTNNIAMSVHAEDDVGIDIAATKDLVVRDPFNMLTNQIIGGYQGWFAFPGDGAPINKWRHWFRDPITNVSAPEANQLMVDMYPTTEEYDEEDMHKSTNILLPDGRGYAKFYSSVRPKVVLKHFEWLANYGITGIFHIRFMQDLHIPANREWKTMVLRNVRNAAEATGRIFAVSYNVAGGSITNDVLEDLKQDWIQLVDTENITQSPRYIRQKGLPVLRIYGFGFKAVNVTDITQLYNLIQWFQTDADEKYRVFLIGGIPSRWRDLTSDSREDPKWMEIYNSFDGIHPWHVGRWSTISNFNSYHADVITQDAKYCMERDILYMPTMWPGFSWYNLKNSTAPINQIPRLGGNFLWKQAYAYAANTNITTIWLAQIDEFDEGTAILKATAKTSDLPVQGKWLALDADGQSLPSDWYLRVTGEAQKMFEGVQRITSVIPIQPTDPSPRDALVKLSSNVYNSTNSGARGIMFTVTAKENIVIRGLDIVPRRKNAGKIILYTRNGSYDNTTYTPHSWQKIFEKQIIVMNNQDNQLFFSNDDPLLRLEDCTVKVRIRAGQTQSFYIFHSSGLKFKTGMQEGTSFVEDSALILHEGRLIKPFFGNTSVGIGQFGGMVRYYIDQW